MDYTAARTEVREMNMLNVGKKIENLLCANVGTAWVRRSDCACSPSRCILYIIIEVRLKYSNPITGLDRP
jgi:hypothetical protein